MTTAPVVSDSSTRAGASVLVDASVVAEHIGVTRGYVYEHADELGVRRLGNGPRARLRFSLAEIDERLSTCTAGSESTSHESAPRAVLRPGRRQRMGASVELLTIRGRIRAARSVQEAS